MLPLVKSLLLVPLCLGVASASARAEELIGVEGDEGAEDAAPPPPKKKADKKKKAPPPEPEDLGDDYGGGGDFSDDITLSGGISAGGSYVGGHITVGYSLHKFVAVDTTYTYLRYSSNDNYGEYYGPEVDLILRYPNKTMVTPFIGAGPGYFKWLREYKGESFDEGDSFTLNQFGGINIALSRHFGLQIVRKQVTYLNDPPIQYGDRSSREARNTVSTNVGFYATF
jgi:hypothetical protein